MSHFATKDKLNIFRLPVAWQYLVAGKLSATLDAAAIESYDHLMQGCLATGAYCIIDIHNYARWNGAVIGASGGPTNADFSDLWKQLATKYAAEEKVVMGLMNEPHDSMEPSLYFWSSTHRPHSKNPRIVEFMGRIRPGRRNSHTRRRSHLADDPPSRRRIHRSINACIRRLSSRPGRRHQPRRQHHQPHLRRPSVSRLRRFRHDRLVRQDLRRLLRAINMVEEQQATSSAHRNRWRQQ